MTAFDEHVALTMLKNRQLLDLSQQQLSRELLRRGLRMHQSAISKIESQQRTITLEEAAAVSRLFRIPLAAFVPDETYEPITVADMFAEIRSIVNRYPRPETEEHDEHRSNRPSAGHEVEQAVRP